MWISKLEHKSSYWSTLVKKNKLFCLLIKHYVNCKSCTNIGSSFVNVFLFLVIPYAKAFHYSKVRLRRLLKHRDVFNIIFYHWRESTSSIASSLVVRRKTAPKEFCMTFFSGFMLEQWLPTLCRHRKLNIQKAQWKWIPALGASKSASLFCVTVKQWNRKTNDWVQRPRDHYTLRE